MADESHVVNRRLYVIGASGNGLDATDTVRDINAGGESAPYEVAGVLDDAGDQQGRPFGGTRIVGKLADAARIARDDPDAVFVNGIGSVNNHWKREAITASTGVPAERFVTLVHPSASVSLTARLGRGCLVFRNVSVCAEAVVGNHVIVLSNSVINHHSVIGDHCCLATAVSVSGHVTVGKGTYLGAGSCLHPHINVGERSLVGMGAVVLKDVAADVVVAGNPARLLRDRKP